MGKHRIARGNVEPHGLGELAFNPHLLTDEWNLQVRGIYLRLMAIDPLRRGYYQDALQGKAFVVIRALGGV